MHEQLIGPISNFMANPDVQKVFTASETFHNMFGSGLYTMTDEEEKQRQPLQELMNSHKELLSPADAITILQEGDSFTYIWDHKDVAPGKAAMCRGYVATTGSENPGIHIFRLDDNTNRQIFERRKSTRQFFFLITNIFISSGIINNQYGPINLAGGAIRDKAIVLTDYNYQPEAICLFENAQYAPNNGYDPNKPLTFANFPWVPEFTALDLKLNVSGYASQVLLKPFPNRASLCELSI